MFGVCSFEILSRGMKPYRQYKTEDVPRFIERGGRLSQPSGMFNRKKRATPYFSNQTGLLNVVLLLPGCPLSVYELLCSCWMHNSSERPSFTTICAALTSALAQLGLDSKDSSPRLRGERLFSRVVVVLF
jgi:hypothetical protein